MSIILGLAWPSELFRVKDFPPVMYFGRARPRPLFDVLRVDSLVVLIGDVNDVARFGLFVEMRSESPGLAEAIARGCHPGPEAELQRGLTIRLRLDFLTHLFLTEPPPLWAPALPLPRDSPFATLETRGHFSLARWRALVVLGWFHSKDGW